MQHGLLCRINKKCYLFEWDAAGTLQDGYGVSDPANWYDGMSEKEFSLVTIKKIGNQPITLRDIKVVALDHHDPDKTVADFLTEGRLPELAQQVYDKYLRNNGKT